MIVRTLLCNTFLCTHSITSL